MRLKTHLHRGGEVVRVEFITPKVESHIVSGYYRLDPLPKCVSRILSPGLA